MLAVNAIASEASSLAGGHMAEVSGGLSQSMLNGWRALTLFSDLLEVTVLPDKGADIYALTDRASGIDPLFKAPWGLQPPGSPPREGSAGAAFLENYEGSTADLGPAQARCLIMRTLRGHLHRFRTGKTGKRNARPCRSGDKSPPTAHWMV
jgi:hypothetical protein